MGKNWIFDENKIGNKIKKCSWENCELEGEYKAPKSKSQIRDYYYFCIEHVRIYNSSWNYYEGMSDQDVEKLVRSDSTWNIPTWPLGKHINNKPQFKESISFENIKFSNIKNDLNDPFNLLDDYSNNDFIVLNNKVSKFSREEKIALRKLELDSSLTINDLKDRYKVLVKKYHPDVNGGNKNSEETLKQINSAYRLLLKKLSVP